MNIIGGEVVESVVEELRRHGILVQDNPGRRLTSGHVESSIYKVAS